jgi:Xaa-Pro aminopeptidase
MSALPPDAETFDPWTAISEEEFRERQSQARQAAAAQGLDAYVVWSRGGAFMDMSQDVLYLTNHYSQQPYIGDEVGIGSGRSHGVCIVPVEGPVTAVIDIPWWREDLVVADDVRLSIHVVETTADAIRSLGLASARLGLVGMSYMTASAYTGLQSQLPDAQLIRADTAIEALRINKSPAELDLIRRACALSSEMMDALVDAVVEGATEAEAIGAGSQVLLAGGGVLYDAACSSGPWVHNFTYARLPSADPIRKLEKGDLFHVDCYGSYGGYFFDFARSRCVGDDPTDDQRALLDAPVEGVDTICAAIRPGATADEIYRVGERWMAESTFVSGMPRKEPVMEGFPAVGHGIGLMWEGPWLMPGDPTVLEEGMYLAAEILLGHPSIGGAMFEQNGVVTNDGFEVLTTARSKRW